MSGRLDAVAYWLGKGWAAGMRSLTPPVRRCAAIHFLLTVLCMVAFGFSAWGHLDDMNPPEHELPEQVGVAAILVLMLLGFPLVWLVALCESTGIILLALPVNSLLWGFALVALGRLCSRTWRRRLARCTAGFLTLAALAVVAPAQDHRDSTVGMPARIEQLVLPGPELEATPTDAKSKVVLRIVATWPHGSAFRYDLEYYGLDPGEYDLKDSLRRKDGSPTSDLPAIPVTVRSVLPAGQIRPHAPERGEPPSIGGYRTILVAGGVLWIAGLAAIVLSGRRKRQAEAARARPRTLAERLKPLVEAAVQGRLSRRERAELELTLVAYWRRKLGLEDRSPEDALALLRDHEAAGPLVRGLEDWLHRPDPPAAVDVAALLSPYQDVAAEEGDLPIGAEGGAAAG